jgi:ribonuclease HI
LVSSSCTLRNINKISIITDSQAVLKAINNYLNFDEQVESIHHESKFLINTLNLKEIRMKWCKAHSNLTGNDLAGKLAKKRKLKIMQTLYTEKFP